MRPGEGRNRAEASSALMRHSKAWPRGATSSWAIDSGSPAATRTCSRTRSMPQTISVIGVLHLDAGVHLEEEELVARDQVLERPGRRVADRPGRPHRGLAHAGAQVVVRRPGWASPRRASGGGAAPSSRARPARRSCRGRRPGPGSRRAAARAGSARGRRSRRRRSARPRAAPPRRRPPAPRRGAGDPEALAAAARRGLDRHRVADLVGDRPRGGEVGHGLGRAGHDRNARPPPSARARRSSSPWRRSRPAAARSRRCRPRRGPARSDAFSARKP